jgi:hypothetical protein
MKKNIRKRTGKENVRYTVQVLSYVHVGRAICLRFVLSAVYYRMQFLLEAGNFVKPKLT